MEGIEVVNLVLRRPRYPRHRQSRQKIFVIYWMQNTSNWITSKHSFIHSSSEYCRMRLTPALIAMPFHTSDFTVAISSSFFHAFHCHSNFDRYLYHSYSFLYTSLAMQAAFSSLRAPGQNGAGETRSSFHGCRSGLWKAKDGHLPSISMRTVQMAFFRFKSQSLTAIDMELPGGGRNRCQSAHH